MTRSNRINQITTVKKIVYILTLSLFLVFVGCESLDFVDPNAPSTDNASFQNLVTGTEGAMRINIDQYLKVVSIFGREAYFFEPADPRFSGELLHGPLDPNGFLLNNPWESRYRTIANTEILIQRANEDPVLTAAEKASVTGFAKTIKAYQLLLNLNYTYENGVVLNISDDVNTPEAGKDESYAFIISLLDEGFSDLQTADDTFFFQLSEGFAGFDDPAGFAKFNRGLRARVGAYVASESGSAQDWQLVLDALEKSFLDEAGDMQTGAYHIFSTALGDRTNSIFEIPSASFVKFRAHPSFKTDAEAGDLRFSSKVLDRSGDPDFQTDFGDTELASNLPITITKSSTDRLSIIRNEELLLLRAEARIGLGDFAGAEVDMNIVRAAAGLAGYTGTDAGNALDRLLHEKRYSLFAEGHRWIDMRRYGRLDQLPIDRTGDANRPDDQVFKQWPIPFDEVPGGS
ncbi:MAG: RagB/SusD family nutrient uptake outer membrane protein [bacterium]